VTSTSRPAIVVAVDLGIGGRRRARHALARAAMLAVELDLALEIVHAVPPTDSLGGLLEGVLAHAHAEAARRLARLARRVRERSPAPPEVRVKVLAGTVVPALFEHARATDPTLIVIGPHLGRPLRDLVVRTTAERLAGRLPCPLLVVRARPRGAWRRALGALDLGPQDAGVVAALARFAAGAEHATVHVIDTPLTRRLVAAGVPEGDLSVFRQRQVDEAGARYEARREALGVAHTVAELRRGDARQEVLAATVLDDHDLVVLGRGGGRVSDVLLGSVSRYLLARARVDVMVVPREAE